uniref:EF-hand domain-containing protein n=1 Tax=Echeneis naucrates TaxID=173247 RepID=A0A665VN84_ECHNA
MSQLLNAITMLREIFYKYSGNEGDKNTLTKGELCELLHKEFAITPGDSSKAAVDDFFKKLDSDQSGLVDFTEYVAFVAALSVITNQP